MGIPTHQELRNMRKKAGLKEAAAAKALGISQGMLSKIESGKADPSYRVLRRMVEYYESELSAERPIERISRIFHRGIASVDASEPISSAIEKMKRNDFSQLPVYSKGKNVGRINEGIICSARLRYGKRYAKKKVGEIMEKVPYLEIGQEEPVSKALSMLTEGKEELLIVTKEGRPVGVVTKSDLMR